MLKPPCVSRETDRLLDIYAELIIKWSETISLVSHATYQNGIAARIDEARMLATTLPSGITEFLDLGSGNGFPAIPLMIMAGLLGEMVEADRRKAAFLQVVVAHLRLHGRVTAGRIEAIPARQSPCITAQALAPLPKLLLLVHRHLRADGQALLIKGRHVDDEIAAAKQDWDFAIRQTTLSATSVVLHISNLRPRKAL